MKNNIQKYSILAIVASILVIPMLSFADAPTTSGGSAGGADTVASSPAPSPAPSSAPVITSTNTGGANASITSTGSHTGGASTVPVTAGGSTGGASGVPITSGGSTGGASSIPTTTGENTGGADTGTPTTPVTPPTGGGGSYGSGGSYSSGGSTVPIFITGTTTYTSCPLITSFMKLGNQNNSAQVIKLQAFLKESEHLDVNLTGIFDSKTETAVKAFQRKYLTDVMGPWDATAPSGIVYITTKKKINELVCKTPLTLSTSELGIINSYIENVNSSSTEIGSTIGQYLGPTASTTVGSSTDNSANTASVINASIWQKIWNWIVHLFKR